MVLDPNKFNLNALQGGVEPDAYSGSDSINVLQESQYVFVEEAFDASGGFRTGRHLDAYKREAFYDQRQKISHYTNFVRPIVRAMLDPVFNADVVREHTADARFDMFLEDVDYNGLTLHKFVAMVCKYVRLHSVCFVVMDNAIDESALTVQDHIDRGIHPYMYMKKAQDVEEYTLARFGHLETVTFRDVVVEIKTKRNETKRVQTYLKWDTETVDRVYKEGGEWTGERVTWAVLETRSHGLGRLPVITIYENPREDINRLLTDSSIYSIARVARTIYNQDSERREQQRNQAFSILCVQEEGDESAGKNIGTANYLKVQAEAHFMPTFISPDVNILRALLEEREQNKNDLFTLADQLGVIGVSKEAKSGIALSYEFSAYEATLQKTAEIAINIERLVVDMYKAYTSADFEYSAAYKTDYSVTNDRQKMDIYEIATALQPAPATVKAIKLDMHKQLFPDTTADEMEIIERELDEQAVQFEQDRQAQLDAMNNRSQFGGDNDGEDKDQ